MHFQGGIGVWSVRGVQQPNFRKLLAKFMEKEKIKILILIEIILDGQKGLQVFASLPFSNVKMTKTIGLAGGIWLL